MKHTLIPSIALFLFVPACDEAPAESCPSSEGITIKAPLNVEASDLEFREKPWASYIQTWQGQKIKSSQFAAAVLACAKIEDPTWLLTASHYLPENSTTGKRVAGLGGSSEVSTAYTDCLELQWKQNNGVEF